MPFRFVESTTPKGSPLLEIHASGHVPLADAEAFGARVAPGGPNHRWRVLLRTQKGLDYEPAARRFFPTTQGNYRAIATLVTNPIVRAAINMMIRVSGGARDFRLFSAEAEALAWLDSFE